MLLINTIKVILAILVLAMTLTVYLAAFAYIGFMVAEWATHAGVTPTRWIYGCFVGYGLLLWLQTISRRGR